MERKIKRGDIYYANLNPVIGSEQGGTRPVLIISNDVGNKHSPTVIVAPITSRIHTKAKLPTHTLINDFEGLDKNSIILFEQIRTIDKQRLRKYVGIRNWTEKPLTVINATKKLRSSAQLSDINTTEYRRCIWPLRLIFMKTTVTSQRGRGLS